MQFNHVHPITLTRYNYVRQRLEKTEQVKYEINKKYLIDIYFAQLLCTRAFQKLQV